MNLLGAIVEHQNSLLRLYRKLEERFEGNSIIQALWRDMSGDISLQIQSIKSLPSSFWNKFKNDSNNNFETAVKKIQSPPADVAEISLRNGFEISLQMAEPIVLGIYARVVRLLREQSTTPALDFYILVKTYVARLVRTTESFSGDPLLIRRARLLVAELEKEVQEPAAEIKALASMALSTKEQKKPVSGKAASPKQDKAARETLIDSLGGMKRKAHGAQEPKHIEKYVEVTSTAQRSDSPAQRINQRFPREMAKIPPQNTKPAPVKPVSDKPAKPAPVKSAKPAPVKPVETAPIKTKPLSGKKPATAKRA